MTRAEANRWVRREVQWRPYPTTTARAWATLADDSPDRSERAIAAAYQRWLLTDTPAGRTAYALSTRWGTE